MSEPFIGEIRIFSGDFAIRDWAFCDGQLLNISSYTALYSLLGTVYGGDGRTTFGVPDLRARVPIHPGRGPGLSSRQLGERVGQSDIPLTINELPQHTHQMMAYMGSPSTGTPNSSTSLSKAKGSTPYAPPTVNLAATSADAISKVGNGGAHDNMQPYLTVNYIIALTGLFPSRS